MLTIVTLCGGCTPARFIGTPSNLDTIKGNNFDTRIEQVEPGLFDVFVKPLCLSTGRDHFQLKQDALEAARNALSTRCPDGVDLIDASNWGELASVNARFTCKK